jgi:hypothetical protein
MGYRRYLSLKKGYFFFFLQKNGKEIFSVLVNNKLFKHENKM